MHASDLASKDQADVADLILNSNSSNSNFQNRPVHPTLGIH